MEKKKRVAETYLDRLFSFLLSLFLCKFKCVHVYVCGGRCLSLFLYMYECKTYGTNYGTRRGGRKSTGQEIWKKTKIQNKEEKGKENLMLYQILRYTETNQLNLIMQFIHTTTFTTNCECTKYKATYFFFLG